MWDTVVLTLATLQDLHPLAKEILSVSVISLIVTLFVTRKFASVPDEMKAMSNSVKELSETMSKDVKGLSDAMAKWTLIASQNIVQYDNLKEVVNKLEERSNKQNAQVLERISGLEREVATLRGKLNT